MSKENDYLIIDKILKGDTNAYGILVEQYKNMVYSISLKVMGNTVDAEDVAQESFIKAYQKLRSFKKESKFSTWLYTISYRTALNNLRKTGTPTLQIQEENTSDFLIDGEETLEFLSEQEQKIKELKKAIDALPRMDGLLITLFYINENSITEISKITGLTESNIKVKLHRIRGKMKKMLKKHNLTNV